MGKNTDKLYITHSEWSSGGLSASSGKSNGQGIVSRDVGKLPFWTCSISQQPIQKDAGMVDSLGHVFDIRNILPYIRKHGTNPVTGEPMTNMDLIKLHIAVNAEGKYIDPISFKEFQISSKPIMIRPSGRVYFEETIKEHNIRAKFMRDLVSDEEFVKNDLIELKGGVGISTGKKIIATSSSIKNGSSESNKNNGVLPSLDKTTLHHNSMLTTHHMASSVTSTAVDPSTEASFKDIPIEKLLKQKKFLEPGYARIETELGDLNIELYPKYSPKAVYNFVQLAKEGFYNGVVFHRNIKHFMIQTGDPTGTGRGGRSAFPGGKPFSDETNTPLKHDERGILSMANKGKHTNTSQFFITYRRTPHLDGKHTVFGKVVGGLSVLDELEKQPVGPSDIPLKPIHMKSVQILVDPFEKGLYDEDLISTKNAKQNETVSGEDYDSPWLKRTIPSSEQLVEPVGKYIGKIRAKTEDDAKPDTATADSDDSRRKRVKTSITKSNFSGW